MRKRKIIPGYDAPLSTSVVWRNAVPPPRPQPIKLPPTKQIDARIQRQARAYDAWRTQYRRLKDEGGRTHHGRPPVKPPAPVTTHFEGSTLVFTRPAHVRSAYRPVHGRIDELVWTVSLAGNHPIHGPCYHLDSYMVMHHKFLRTIPSKRLLVVRGPTPQQSLAFKALSQEWVRIASDRSNRIGMHRWLVYIVGLTTRK